MDVSQSATAHAGSPLAIRSKTSRLIGVFSVSISS